MNSEADNKPNDGSEKSIDSALREFEKSKQYQKPMNDEIVISEKNFIELRKYGITNSDKIQNYRKLAYYAVIPEKNIKFGVFVYPDGNDADPVPSIVEITIWHINKEIKRVESQFKNGKMPKEIYEQIRASIQKQLEANRERISKT
jgi:hypothetical protein